MSDAFDPVRQSLARVGYAADTEEDVICLGLELAENLDPVPIAEIGLSSDMTRAEVEAAIDDGTLPTVEGGTAVRVADLAERRGAWAFARHPMLVILDMEAIGAASGLPSGHVQIGLAMGIIDSIGELGWWRKHVRWIETSDFAPWGAALDAVAVAKDEGRRAVVVTTDPEARARAVAEGADVLSPVSLEAIKHAAWDTDRVGVEARQQWGLDYLAMRAARGDPERALALLDRVATLPPEPGDEMPNCPPEGWDWPVDPARLSERIVASDAHTLGGTPRFRGTRVPVDTLFVNLADGIPLDEILDEFPTLDRADCVAVLWQAMRMLERGALATR